MTLNAAAQYQKHCPGCFQLKAGVATCPHCGYDESVARSPLFLPHGTILGGQYRAGRVLGRPGGFGITYLGWDVNLQQRVAIKEYLPREIAQRMPNSLEVDVHTAEDRRGFEFGKEQFLREARIVAKLDHANIVRVRNFFNSNSTAYLVMDYYEGMSLGDYLATVRSRLEPELAVPLVKPILEGLQYVHERGLVHRDLKPHNIYLAAIGRPIVLDFGAARQAAGDRVQSLSVVLTEGYAPLEQYQRRAVQGPWTDVYGVAATLYRMITGAAPPIALDRIGRDPVEDGGWAVVPQTLVPALRMALAVRPSDRYQSAIEFHAALDRFMSGTTAGNTAGIMPPPAADASPAVEAARVTAPPSQGAETVAPTVAPSMQRPSIVGKAAAPTVTRPAIQPPMPKTTPRAMPQAETVEVVLPTRVVNAIQASSPVPPPLPLPPAAPLASKPATMPPPVVYAGQGARTAVPRAEVRALPGAPLHYRATEVRQPSITPAPRSGLLRGLPWVLLLLASTAVGYVLLNPPGEAERRPPPDAVATTTLAAAARPQPVEQKLSAKAEIPALVLLPPGAVRLAAVGTSATDTSRTARIPALRMGRTEVTVAEFRDFVQRTGYDNPRWQNYPCESAGGRLPDWQNPGYAQRDESPVVCVSWADANAYTQWLSRETGKHFRLPTEAEWEYAARAGTSSRYWWGSGFDPGMAACQSCPPKVPTQPAVAAAFPANPFGLYETLGNVREWTCSTYGGYDTAEAEQCGTPHEGAQIAVRGGSWLQTAEMLGADMREAYEPYRRNVWTGFRVAQDEQPLTAELSAP